MGVIPDVRAIPVVGAYAYRETLSAAHPPFTASVVPEPQNRHNPSALAVHLDNGLKAGYIPPDLARHLYPAIAARQGRGDTTSGPARLDDGGRLDVLLLVDLSALAGIQDLT